MVFDNEFLKYLYYQFLFRLSKRKFWKNPGRTDLWWQNLINEKTFSKEWFKNIRMDFDSFMKLTDMLRVFVTPNSKHLGKIKALYG